jgi:DNA repair protein RadA/Sms
MAKAKSVFYCQNCGAQSPKWIGRCPSCNEWNTYVEELIHHETPGKGPGDFLDRPDKKARPIHELEIAEEPRVSSGDGELDRVLGGGIVPGSLVLIGGEPGIGKSTLMLQVALHMKGRKVLYVSGEESSQQIRMRAERLGVMNEECFISTETETYEIFRQAHEIQPELMVIDSIQTLHTSSIESSAGSVSQIRECSSEFQKYCKQTAVPVVLIGHITKDGSIAGPKVLEHMVDTVLQFEGDRNHVYRILRGIKNRFGPSSELGIYEMRQDGLREVDNPSDVLLSHHQEEISGVSIAATIEGIRPMLIEVQALVSTAAYGTPQRSATGFDLRRLNMLLAVLEKRCGFRLGAKDVFLNMAGGIRVEDPATDLAVVVAILSSSEEIPCNTKYCFAAEVGLSGEIRPVGRIEQRIGEAEKLGFEHMIISRYNSKGLDEGRHNIQLHYASRIEEVFQLLFG